MKTLLSLIAIVLSACCSTPGIQENPGVPDWLEVFAEYEMVNSRTLWEIGESAVGDLAAYRDATEELERALARDVSVSADLELAKRWVAFRRRDIAVNLLTRMIEQGVDRYSALYSRALLYAQQAKWSLALADLQLVLSGNPDWNNGWSQKVVLVAYCQREAVAREELRTLPAKFVGKGHFALGLMAMGRGELSLAEEYFTAALVDEGGGVRKNMVRVHRALVYRRLGLRDLSLADAEAAIARTMAEESQVRDDDYLWTAYQIRAQARKERGDFFGFIEDQRAISRLAVRDEAIYADLAARFSHDPWVYVVAAFRFGVIAPGSISYLDHALALDPELGDAFYWRAFCKSIQSPDRLDNAYPDSAAAYERLSANSHVWRQHFAICQALAKFEEALLVARGERARAPDSLDALEDEIRALVSLGRNEEAAALCEPAMAKHPKSRPLKTSWSKLQSSGIAPG